MIEKSPERALFYTNAIMKNFLFIIIIATFVQTKLQAQNTGKNELGSWYEITASNRISDKFSLSGSFTNWNYELPAKNEHLLLGIVGLNYYINDNIELGIGYAIGDIDTSFKVNDIPHLKENRILEQILLKHKSNTIGFSHRFRLEQRFLKYQTENLVKHRLRYRFKTNIPLNNMFFVIVYDEIHFVLNAFDLHQNRACIELGAKLNKNINLHFGYAKHSYKAKNFNRLSLQVNLNYDFRKPKSILTQL